MQDLISKNFQRVTHPLSSPRLLCLSEEVGALGELGASLSWQLRNKMSPVGLDLAMYIIEMVGKAREVKVGRDVALSGCMAQSSWMGSRCHISTSENSGSKDVLAGTVTTHTALSSLAYQPREWIVFHRYGSF